jgi:hypothetical protein
MIFVYAQSYYLMNKQIKLYNMPLCPITEQASLLNQNINDTQKSLTIFVYTQFFHLINKQLNY